MLDQEAEAVHAAVKEKLEEYAELESENYSDSDLKEDESENEEIN